jgi:catechol 2,3-dioxygenase-like lactoylglutathione lyase family enzyme
MSVQLNHTIIWCRDKRTSADFLADILGRPEPTPFSIFLVMALDNGVSLDFGEVDHEVAPQHYAFQVDEPEFKRAFARVGERGLDYWADPGRTRRGEIYRHGDSRGFYFQDPDNHLLEVLTRSDAGG